MRDVLSWSFPIGQMFGIMVRVHFLLPFFMLGLIGRTTTEGYWIGTWQDAATLMMLMFFSILLHEFGHCFAARYMDGEADEILMWPLGGLAYCRALPHKPLAHFVVAAGGPLVTLLLCVVSGLVIYFGFDHLPPLKLSWYPYRVADNSLVIHAWTWSGARVPIDNLGVILLMRFFWINWILFLFNTVLVGHPFDSGRMLQAALWPRWGHYQSSKIAVYAGFVVMVILGVWSIIDKEPLFAYLTVFIFMACSQELATLEAERDESLFGYDFSEGYTSLEKDEPRPVEPKKKNFIQRWLDERAAKREQEEMEQREADDQRMDELLDKIQKFGIDTLTDEEKRFMKRVSDRYKNK